MVFRLGLNGLHGAGEEPSLCGLGFGVFSCTVLDVALSSCNFRAGNGGSGIAEHVIILPFKLYEVLIYLEVHTHELHSFPLAADHIFRFSNALTSVKRGVYRADPPKDI